MNTMTCRLDEAYRLINTGPVVLVSTVSKNRSDKLTTLPPLPGHARAKSLPARVLIGVGRNHKTFTNIEETGEFVVSVPNISQVEMVTATGSVSGADVDKFAELDIPVHRCPARRLQNSRRGDRLPRMQTGRNLRQ